MIYSPRKNNQNSTTIESAIKDFVGYQIAISIVLPSPFCLYDRILTINSLLLKIHSKYRQINRRANISDFLIVLSDNIDRTSLCTVLIRHNTILHDTTVCSRILLIKEIVSVEGLEANVFNPLNLTGSDFNRYHLKNISGAFSINILKPNEKLHLRDCAEID